MRHFILAYLVFKGILSSRVILMKRSSRQEKLETIAQVICSKFREKF